MGRPEATASIVSRSYATELAVCIPFPTTEKSIPGVECMGKVVELGSTLSYGKWPTTPT